MLVGGASIREVRRPFFIMKNLILLLFMLLAALNMFGCGARRKLLDTSTRDSVRVEIIEKVQRVTDTVTITVDREVEKILTKDSTSILENTVAKSSAIVLNGLLSHSLETKPQEVVKEVVFEVQTRDSIVWRDKEITNIIEVERELTPFQKFRLSFFWVILAAGAAFVVGKFKLI